MLPRTRTKAIAVGNTIIGGKSNVVIQSMCNTDTRNALATIKQIKELEAVGCEIIRVTVPDIEAAEAIKVIRKEINIPLVADIHFDYRMAIEAIKNGADKIRINPGNIGIDRLKYVVEEAKTRNIPIRVGVNSGSLEKDILAKYGRVTAEGLCESAVRNVKLIEAYDYDKVVVSIKSSDALMCKEAYSQFSNQMDYPLHIGVTEAGTVFSGAIKSAVGLGLILNEGIGDTIRVSLSGDPIEEIKAAKIILRSLNLYNEGVNVVACPTCGRTEIDLIPLANKIENLCEGYSVPITVAVMGCVVNGPGEAREAEIGIAGGKGEALVFKKGKAIKKLPEDMLFSYLKEELDSLNKEYLKNKY